MDLQTVRNERTYWSRKGSSCLAGRMKASLLVNWIVAIRFEKKLESEFR